MISNATYSLTYLADLVATQIEFTGVIQFKFTNFMNSAIVGMRAFCYIHDNDEVNFEPASGWVKLGQATVPFGPQTMAKRVNVSNDGAFTADDTSGVSTVIPINGDTIDLGAGLKVDPNITYTLSIETQWTPAIGVAAGLLTAHFILHVMEPNEGESPDPVSGKSIDVQFRGAGTEAARLGFS